MKPIEEKRATLAGPGITSHLLKSNKISSLVTGENSEGLRKYNYSLM